MQLNNAKQCNESKGNYDFWIANNEGVYNDKGDLIYPLFGVKVNGEIIHKIVPCNIQTKTGIVKKELPVKDFNLQSAIEFAKEVDGVVVITLICTIFK